MRWNAKEGRRTPNSEVVKRKYRRNRAVVYAPSIFSRANSIDALRGVGMEKWNAYGRRSMDDIVGGVA